MENRGQGCDVGLLCRDHAGGNEKMLRMMPGLKVYGGDDRVDALTKKVTHSNTFKVRRSECTSEVSMLCSETPVPCLLCECVSALKSFLID